MTNHAFITALAGRPTASQGIKVVERDGAADQPEAFKCLAGCPHMQPAKHMSQDSLAS